MTRSTSMAVKDARPEELVCRMARSGRFDRGSPSRSCPVRLALNRDVGTSWVRPSRNVCPDVVSLSERMVSPNNDSIWNPMSAESHTCPALRTDGSVAML